MFGTSPITDARIMFALVAAAAVVLSLRLLGWPKVPVRAGQLAVASPLTALTFAVAGPDLAIIGLMILAGALAVRDRYGWSAVVIAVVMSMKLTALPGLVPILFLIGVRAGGKVVARVLAVIIAITAVVNVPVLIVQPGAFVEHVIKFPAGAGRISSPAASPFPGHLLASAGPVGHALALVLVGLTAVALVAWLVRRPPATGSSALVKAAVVLGVALLVVPASRYGYVVYPLALWGRRSRSRWPSGPRPGRPPRQPIPCAGPKSGSPGEREGCVREVDQAATSSSCGWRHHGRAASRRTRTAPGARTRTTGPWTPPKRECWRLFRTSS
ncbi:hypothetical protein GCM10029964_046410 [Kibdelosporangium lantanae]